MAIIKSEILQRAIVAMHMLSIEPRITPELRADVERQLGNLRALARWQALGLGEEQRPAPRE